MSKEELSSPTLEDNESEEAVWDQSARAGAILNHILKSDIQEDKEVAQSEKPDNRVSTSEAIHARPVLDIGSGRDLSRVLFVTTNDSVLTPGSADRTEYLKLAKYFDEVHVMCLIPRRGEESFDRAGDNTWFYKVQEKNWWRLPWVARSSAKEALTWNGIFRPDVVVGFDPFEAGLAARLIAHRWKCPYQLHIKTNPFVPNFKELAPDNSWRLRIAKYLLKRSKSVRTKTTLLKDVLVKQYPKLLDIEVLPRFYNFTGLLNAEPAFDLRERYPDFAFVILAFGTLTADSHLHDLFASLHRTLKNPRIGMIVVGDGPAKELFEEKVKLLGIERNVVFKKEAEDLASYLKTANVLAEMSTTEEGDARVLQAASAGLPIVAYATDLRRDLFGEEHSAFLVEPKDLLDFSQKVSKLINVVALRKQFSDNAQAIAKDRLTENPEAHYLALRNTIESVLITNASSPSTNQAKS